MRFSRDYQVEFEDHRCYGCGRYWASEVCGKQASCPFCASSDVAQARSELDTQIRRASSFKAAATRAKARLKSKRGA